VRRRQVPFPGIDGMKSANFRILFNRTLSSAGSERLPYKQEVTGSNPVASTLPYPAEQQRDPHPDHELNKER
jgi:hypothetical protein